MIIETTSAFQQAKLVIKEHGYGTKGGLFTGCTATLGKLYNYTVHHNNNVTIRSSWSMEYDLFWIIQINVSSTGPRSKFYFKS